MIAEEKLKLIKKRGVRGSPFNKAVLKFLKRINYLVLSNKHRLHEFYSKY